MKLHISFLFEEITFKCEEEKKEKGIYSSCGYYAIFNEPQLISVNTAYMEPAPRSGRTLILQATALRVYLAELSAQ